MKKTPLLALVLIVAFVFAQPWDARAIDDHPWEGDNGVPMKTAGTDGNTFSFTVPSLLVDMLGPLFGKPCSNGRYVCFTVYTVEGGWVTRCYCADGLLH